MSTVYKEIMLLVLLTMKDRLKLTVLPCKNFFESSEKKIRMIESKEFCIREHFGLEYDMKMENIILHRIKQINIMAT